jgi:hypothetical protein
VDAVIDIQAITYDKKRIDVMRRKSKKRSVTLDSTLLITIEETLLNTENAKTTKMIEERMVIIDAMLDIVKRDEKELVSTKKELDHPHHLVKYYQDLT